MTESPVRVHTSSSRAVGRTRAHSQSEFQSLDASRQFLLDEWTAAMIATFPSHPVRVRECARRPIVSPWQETTHWVADERLLDAIACRVRHGPVLDVATGPGHSLRARSHSRDSRIRRRPFFRDVHSSTIYRTSCRVCSRKVFRPKRLQSRRCRQALHYLDLSAALAQGRRCRRRAGRIERSYSDGCLGDPVDLAR